MLLKVDCLPNAVGKQPSIPLINLGRKWTLNMMMMIMMMMIFYKLNFASASVFQVQFRWKIWLKHNLTHKFIIGWSNNSINSISVLIQFQYQSNFSINPILYRSNFSINPISILNPNFSIGMQNFMTWEWWELSSGFSEYRRGMVWNVKLVWEEFQSYENFFM